jgi:hypothetical protein
MEFDDDLWPGDWREIGTAAKDIAAHKGFDLAVAKVAVCRTTFSDGKVNKRLVEYEWDEYRQVLVADQSRGVASMSTTGRSSARTVLIGQRPARVHGYSPKKEAILGGHKSRRLLARHRGAPPTPRARHADWQGRP